MNYGKDINPLIKTLKVWGCLANVQVLLPKRTKLGPKTIDCVFIGYANIVLLIGSLL